MVRVVWEIATLASAARVEAAAEWAVASPPLRRELEAEAEAALAWAGMVVGVGGGWDSCWALEVEAEEVLAWEAWEAEAGVAEVARLSPSPGWVARAVAALELAVPVRATA